MCPMVSSLHNQNILEGFCQYKNHLIHLQEIPFPLSIGWQMVSFIRAKQVGGGFANLLLDFTQVFLFDGFLLSCVSYQFS